MRKNRNTSNKTRNAAPPTDGKGAAKSTVSGPRKGAGSGSDPAVRKAEGTQALAAAFPYNPNKPGEIGEASRTPQARRHRGAARPDGDRQHPHARRRPPPRPARPRGAA